jgi:uncharacterized membrane protein YbhN (UPF0104 family)
LLRCLRIAIKLRDFDVVSIESRVLRAGLGGLLVLCAGVVLYRVFAHVDVRATLEAMARAGRLAPVALAPFLAGMAADASGMTLLLGALGRPVGLSKVLKIRIATEALHMTAPAGFVVADAAAAGMLDAQHSVPVGDGAILAVARKWLVMRAHAIYITLGAVIGAGSLAVLSSRWSGGPHLAFLLALGLALVPLSLSLIVGAGFGQRGVVARLQGAAARLPWASARAHVARWRAGALACDAQMSKVGAARRETLVATACFLGCWLAEALETALLLWLVGGPFDLPLAMAIETAVSLLRSVANIAPAGLGVQEAGYATLLTGTGVAVDTAAAFVLLKRCKELFWIAGGYALLAGMRRPEAGRAYAGALRFKPEA